MSARILVVEDDPSLSEVVCSLLVMNGYACVPAFSGTEARMLVERAARDCAAGGFGVARIAWPARGARPVRCRPAGPKRLPRPSRSTW